MNKSNLGNRGVATLKFKLTLSSNSYRHGLRTLGRTAIYVQAPRASRSHGSHSVASPNTCSQEEANEGVEKGATNWLRWPTSSSRTSLRTIVKVPPHYLHLNNALQAYQLHPPLSSHRSQNTERGCGGGDTELLPPDASGGSQQPAKITLFYFGL